MYTFTPIEVYFVQSHSSLHAPQITSDVAAIRATAEVAATAASVRSTSGRLIVQSVAEEIGNVALRKCRAPGVRRKKETRKEKGREIGKQYKLCP